MIDWRAVVAGTAAGTAYLGFLASVPGLEELRWSAVALVLATGLVAGAVAGLLAGAAPAVDADAGDVRDGALHGLLAGSLSGAVVAVAFVLSLRTNTHLGVFYGLNYLLATSASDFPIVRSRGDLVIAVLAGLGWSVIALLGLYAGREAPKRETHAILESEN